MGSWKNVDSDSAGPGGTQGQHWQEPRGVVWATEAGGVVWFNFMGFRACLWPFPEQYTSAPFRDGVSGHHCPFCSSLGNLNTRVHYAYENQKQFTCRKQGTVLFMQNMVKTICSWKRCWTCNFILFSINIHFTTRHLFTYFLKNLFLKVDNQLQTLEV